MSWNRLLTKIRADSHNYSVIILLNTCVNQSSLKYRGLSPSFAATYAHFSAQMSKTVWLIHY